MQIQESYPSLRLWAVAAAGFVLAVSAPAQPNLTPFQPPGWSDKLVVTTSDTSTNDSPNFLTTDNLFVDWCVINSGTLDVNVPFFVYVYVDGVFSQMWGIPLLPVDEYEYVTGYPIGSLSAGTHSVKVVADATGVVIGDNESDNSYTKTITVGAVTLPAPSLLAPANSGAGLPAVPAFSWSAVNNASSYRILIATAAADLPTISTATNGGASVAVDAVTLTTNFSPTVTLNPNTTYYWEVHANPNTDNGVWSGIQQFTTQPTPSGLTIVPTWDSTITSDPRAATIEATILAAISVYRSSFSDPVTANFTFAEMSGGLGFNNAQELFVNYSDYLAALAAHATTTDDAAALSSLPSGPNNPVNGNSQMALKFPLARALGFDTGAPGLDATIYLNTSIMNISSFSTDPNKYSLFSTVSHEMDEALAFGSLLNGLTNGEPAPTDPPLPQDLFRYDTAGDRSFTTALGAVAYFSLDGTTNLAQFNQYDGGDFADWFSYNATVVPQVQNAFLVPGVNPILGVELRGLDALGFTRVIPNSMPSPAQLTGPTISAGTFQFNISGTSGASYVVQASTDLVTWLPLTTNTLSASGLTFLTFPVNQPAYFYRAVAQ